MPILLNQCQELVESDGLPTLVSRLDRIAADMGFGIFSIMSVTPSVSAESDHVFACAYNCDSDYVEIAADPSDSRRDPVMRQMRRSSIPFLYDRATYARAGCDDLWEKQAPWGFKTGVATAIHMPGDRHFLFGCDRPDPLPKDPRRQARLLANLQLVAVHALEPACRLLLPAVHGDVERLPSTDGVKFTNRCPVTGISTSLASWAADPSKASSMPLKGQGSGMHLTGREIEILKWTKDGKSAWVVGTILSISEHTVNFHLGNIRRKLGVSSKHHAAIKAAQLGLIS